MSEQLLRNLKNFAFEECPQFADGLVHAMSVERTFYLPDSTPADSREFPNPDNAEFSIEMGLSANRYHNDRGRKVYRFDTYAVGWQHISPYELKLTEDDWYDIQSEYDYASDDELSAQFDTLDGALQEIDDNEETAPMKPKEIQDLLNEDQVECTFYRRIDFRFETDDNQIRFNEEQGYTVDEQGYNVNETHLNYLDKSSHKLSLHDETILEDGTIEALQGLFQFYDVTKDLRQQLQKSGNIMPPEDGASEILFLINCLRQKKAFLF